MAPYPVQMDRLVQVPTQPGGSVFPSLSEVLASIAPRGTEFAWTIFSLDWFVTAPGNEVDQGAFLERVEGGAHGLELSFDDLVAFASTTVQIVDGMFLGCRRSRPFPDAQADDETIMSTADVMLSAFDSSFWIVGGPEPLLQDVEASFVTRAEPPGGPLRT